MRPDPRQYQSSRCQARLGGFAQGGPGAQIFCSVLRQIDFHMFDGLYRPGQVEQEFAPQDNLSVRIRAAGAGIGGFFTSTGYVPSWLNMPMACPDKLAKSMVVGTCIRQPFTSICPSLRLRLTTAGVSSLSTRRRVPLAPPWSCRYAKRGYGTQASQAG